MLTVVVLKYLMSKILRLFHEISFIPKFSVKGSSSKLLLCVILWNEYSFKDLPNQRKLILK